MSGPRIGTFARLANGNVQPKRIIAGQQTKLSRTMHGIVYNERRDELVVPASFPMSAHASLSDHGIVAYAYDLEGDTFTLDLASSQLLRGRIAEAYREAAASPQAERERRAHFLSAADKLSDPSCQ